MPDSQLTPPWGLAYDERDLDALLSGETRGTPLALQPVASTLAALRAAATGRELSDEAVARAAFRAFAPAPSTTGPLPWTAGAEPAAVTSHTLVLPPADRPQRAARHRRPAARSARKPRIALTGAAAAALVVVAAVVTGTLTGSIGKLTSFGRQPASASASARATGQSPGSQGTLVTGAASERTQNPKPTVSAPAPGPTPRPASDPASLCRQYLGYFEHPAMGEEAARIALDRQLATLAGGPFKISGYCFRTLDTALGGKDPWPQAGVSAGDGGATGQANPGSGSVGAGSQGNPASGTSDQDRSAGPGAGVSTP
jgi:hypothetical protein